MDDNVVYIGKKPIMSYVLAVVTQFGQGHIDVIIKARGKAINRAVDVAEIVRNRFVADCMVQFISIGTEKLESEDGHTNNVSWIEIKLRHMQ